MKTKILTNFMIKFVTIFAVFSLLLFQIYSMADGLNGIYSRNGYDVIAVGNNGLIIKSFDSGINWGNYSSGTTNYNSVSGKNQFIWIVGDSGVVLSSSNGGNSFSRIYLNQAINLRSVFFFNTTSGWIAGNNGYIYHTSNGGLNWLQQAAFTSNNLNCIKFADAQNGVVCGDSGTILVSTNGGTNWISSSVPVNKNIFSADIYSATIYASGQNAIVLKSTNMGNNWSFIDYKIITRSDINSIIALNADTFYSCAVGGAIRKSPDGGNTFKFLQSPLFPDLHQVYFYGSNYWAISQSTNVVLRSSDDGDSWNLPLGVTQNLSWTLKLPTYYYTSSGNVFYLSPYNKNEIFITNLNKVYRSLNRGETWSQISTIPYASGGYSATTNSFLVSPKDTNIFLAAIDSNYFHGKVFRSTNYGVSWTATKTSFRTADGIPLAMDPNHTDTVYYGTTDSVIFRSTNFGLTWAPAGPKIFAYNCSMKVLEGHSNIIFCGAAEDTSVGLSYLYKSTDYGLSWTAVDSNSAPNYPELPAIVNSIMNPDTLYASFFEGSQGGLKRSLNQGNTWNFVNIDEVVWGLDIAKDDPNVICYGDGYNFNYNITYYTIDGGMHFSPLPALNSANFAVLFYNRNTLFLQQGLGFYKLNISYSNPIGIKQISSNVPQKFYLYLNYPNPFNPVTRIKFDFPPFTKGGQGGFVTLKIYDILGREVATLVNEQLKPGTYEVRWDGSNCSSGVYFYRLITEGFTETKKLVLLK